MDIKELAFQLYVASIEGNKTFMMIATLRQVYKTFPQIRQYDYERQAKAVAVMIIEARIEEVAKMQWLTPLGLHGKAIERIADLEQQKELLCQNEKG